MTDWPAHPDPWPADMPTWEERVAAWLERKWQPALKEVLDTALFILMLLPWFSFAFMLGISLGAH